ncbi:rod-binding protein [Sphingomonas sp.]|uniref:rod-binding protein n=1 Tax=Sphingomonas sp. TaxID=28214 RepID=UPI0025F238FE|nr:rod-binding protein [Sphingomonas sp.]
MIQPVSNAPITPLTKAAKALEAVFLRQMIAAMRTSTLSGDDSTQFRDMSDANLADKMAGGFGIAAMVEHQMKEHQP